LQIFLSQTGKLVRHARKGLSTHLCKSFNAVKAHFSHKTYAWQLTWPICAMCAMAQLNSTELWKFGLFCVRRLPGHHQRAVQLLREPTAH
jgi:hypothetical protein